MQDHGRVASRSRGPVRGLILGTAVGLVLLPAGPAAAQSFFERLFRSTPAPEAQPAAPAPAAPIVSPESPAAPAWPVRMSVLPPKRPSAPTQLSAAPLPADSQAADPQPPAQQAAAGALPAVQPPATSRPSTPAAPAKPVVTAAATPDLAAVTPQEPLTPNAIVERANAYFTNLGTLVAEFTQIGGDGRRLGGTLYLQRPGRVRFDYNPPATLEVVADGSSVAVRDRKLNTQDLYSIGQTPLKFLLRERVNLGQDIKITGVTNEGDGIRIDLEDRSTLGGTSRIMLYFDARVDNLQQWRIVDAQGFQTTVVLNKAERPRRLDASLFAIEYLRPMGGGGNQ